MEEKIEYCSNLYILCIKDPFGFIEELQGKVLWGRIYIIAPENACSGVANWAQFEEVWQYGSNNNPEDGNLRDPLNEQDGIAPQCAVLGVDDNALIIPHGRAYIPASVSTKSFLGSHKIANYGWIFTSIKEGEDGYVKKR